VTKNGMEMTTPMMREDMPGNGVSNEPHGWAGWRFCVGYSYGVPFASVLESIKGPATARRWADFCMNECTLYVYDYWDGHQAQVLGCSTWQHEAR
jgi:hypothetical protein